MLTKVQKHLLDFLVETIGATGITPSYDEMCRALNLKSKSGIHRLVLALEERGFIRRLANRARAIEVLQPTVEVLLAKRKADAADVGNIPLMGKIGAGSPAAAIQVRLGSFAVSRDLAGGVRDLFALTVVGDSMIEAGIVHGDTLVVSRQNTAIAEDVVVAIVGGQAVLKRQRRKGDTILLESANPAYPSEEYLASDVAILGRVVQLQRTL